ncbi:hypothetical protein LOZ66_004923 [Ophidiomyces ophidiicola]|nr:hypothetical protein LOZ66_004923 [Ophidiomyces ophidiicola]
MNYVALLLDNTDDPKSCIDVCEAAKGCTPLILTAASGSSEVVKILLEAGANLTVLDSKGWTAQEHAAFRGHLYTSNFLGPCNILDSLDSYGSKLDRVKIDPLGKDDRKFIIIHLGSWYFRRPNPRLTSSVLKHNLVPDVQVTRDLVPVIYHDFLLSELGSDVPIHGVDLARFFHAGNHAELEKLESRTPLSRSLTREDDSEARSRSRLQHTVDFMGKGYKPNSRGTFIQRPFTILEYLLVQLPKNLGFFVETKYPRLHEAAEAGVAPIAIELNTYLDAVLERIYRFGLDRGIILASFTPEVCILLAKKATGFPVFFITNAGKLPITDMEKRGASLQASVQLARLWNLAGIILVAETFLLCPRLIKYVQMAGLVCVSDGLVNNVPENAKLQSDAGIDMLIVDRVGLISRLCSVKPS